VLTAREDEVDYAPGCAPHYVGIFETLAAAREMQLDAPRQVSLVLVEAQDCLSIGGGITPEVGQALPEVVEAVRRLLAEELAGAPAGATVD
jgi:Ni,Fe-hydrogenase maturation factor